MFDSQAGGNVEMTWVVTDYTATPGTNEVSVTKGQQVEIIETVCNGSPDFCLVRLNIHSGSAADGSGTIEGIVPMTVLKLAPSIKVGHRKGTESNDNKESTESGESICPKLIVSYSVCFSHKNNYKLNYVGDGGGGWCSGNSMHYNRLRFLFTKSH